MNVVVVLELCKGEEIGPIVLSLVDEELEVLFKLLIYLFSLTISLRVVRRSSSQLDFEQSVKFLSELSHELGSPIGHDSTR